MAHALPRLLRLDVSGNPHLDAAPLRVFASYVLLTGGIILYETPEDHSTATPRDPPKKRAPFRAA